MNHDDRGAPACRRPAHPPGGGSPRSHGRQSAHPLGTALLVGAITLFVVLVAACAGDGDASGAQATGYHTPKLTSVATASPTQQLPFDQYRLSDLDRLRIDTGLARLLQSCLQQRWPDAPTDLHWESDYIRPHDGRLLLWGGPFGTMSLEHARRFGYRAGPSDPSSRGPGLYIKTVYNLSFAQVSSDATQQRLDRIVDGIESGGGEVEQHADGCRATVYSDLAAPIVDISDTQSDVMNLAFNHPQAQERMKRWARCMRDAGETEYTEVDGPVTSFALAPLSNRQIRVAVKDVKCTQESRWADYYYAALADYEQQAIKAKPQLFESALRSERDLLSAIERQ
jgi:hypothetical protein